MAREASVERNTKETEIKLKLTLDGTGYSDIETGVGFFNHMLDGFTRHGLFDLCVRVQDVYKRQALKTCTRFPTKEKLKKSRMNFYGYSAQKIFSSLPVFIVSSTLLRRVIEPSPFHFRSI